MITNAKYMPASAGCPHKAASTIGEGGNGDVPTANALR